MLTLNQCDSSRVCCLPHHLHPQLCQCLTHECSCRFLPYVGQVTIIMNDYPALKYALIGVLAIFVIVSKE